MLCIHYIYSMKGRVRIVVFVAVAVIGSAIDLWAGWALKHLDASPETRLGIALVPLPANLALIAMVLARIRRLDEFQKRIHFEASVVAFLATGVGVFIFSYLRLANAVAPLDGAWVWAF